MSENGLPSALGQQDSPGQRLESWKEIAAYLRRDVRTVQRWEKAEKLPVHRHVHNKLPTIYAYTAEIDAWWGNGHDRLALLEDGLPEDESKCSTPGGTQAQTGELDSSLVVRNPRLLWAIVCAAVIAIIVFAGTLLYLWRRTTPAPQFVERQLTANPLDRPIEATAISPDGKYLAYSDLSGLNIKLIDEDETRLIAFPVSGLHVRAISWFPNQTKLALSVVTAALDGESIWTVSLLSGSFHKLVDSGYRPAVSPDGKEIAFVRLEQPRELWLIGEDGQDGHRIYTSEQGTRITQPVWAFNPLIALTSVSIANPSTLRVVTVDPRLGTANLVFSYPVSTIWPRLQWSSGGILLFQRREYPPAKVPSTSVAQDIWQIPISKNGKPGGLPTRLTFQGSYWGDLSTSIDGRRICAMRTQSEEELYAAELTLSENRISWSRRITNQTWPQTPESWGADGRFLFFNSDQAGHTNIFRTNLHDEPEALVSGPGKRWNPQATGDGRWIYFWSEQGGSGWPKTKTLMRIPASGGMAESVRLSDSRDEFVCSRGSRAPCFLFEAGKNPIPILRMDLASGMFTTVASLTRDHLHLRDDWAPSLDGSKLALVNENLQIEILNLSSGKIEAIPMRENVRVGNVTWLNDESGFLVTSWPVEDTLNLLRRNGTMQPLIRFDNKSFDILRLSTDGKRIAFALNTSRRDAFLLQQK